MPQKHKSSRYVELKPVKLDDAKEQDREKC